MTRQQQLYEIKDRLDFNPGTDFKLTIFFFLSRKLVSLNILPCCVRKEGKGKKKKKPGFDICESSSQQGSTLKVFHKRRVDQDWAAIDVTLAKLPGAVALRDSWAQHG